MSTLRSCGNSRVVWKRKMGSICGSSWRMRIRSRESLNKGRMAKGHFSLEPAANSVPLRQIEKDMMTFEGLGLEPRLVQATDALGFKQPTPIQEQAIPVLLSGTKDLVGLAQTGTGKTAAFGLPLLQLVDAAQRYPQALVVCPTRELCMQIVTEVESFKQFIPGIHVQAVYGGTSIGLQIKDLRRGVQIVVATPGRLIDLIERKADRK